jgi:hypothetical protein
MKVKGRAEVRKDGAIFKKNKENRKKIWSIQKKAVILQSVLSLWRLH